MKRLLLATLALTVGLAPTAHAESVYRYWSYWQGDGSSWRFAQVGVGSIAVADGQVQGWRFITSGSAKDSTLTPRVNPDFAEICGAVEVPVGKSRVAVVIDYGDAADYPGEVAPPAPTAQCVVADTGISSAVLLADNAQIRANDGFVCGINGRPASGCGEAVDSELVANDAAQDQLARWVTTGLGVILFALTWRGLMRQKGWRWRQ